MKKETKDQVLEILDYWKTIEFLGQTDIPAESSNNKELIQKLEKGEKTDEEKIEIFMEIFSPDVNIEKIVGEDTEKYIDYPSTGEDISFCIGRIERNTVVEYLKRFIDSKE